MQLHLGCVHHRAAAALEGERREGVAGSADGYVTCPVLEAPCAATTAAATTRARSGGCGA